MTSEQEKEFETLYKEFGYIQDLLTKREDIKVTFEIGGVKKATLDIPQSSREKRHHLRFLFDEYFNKELDRVAEQE